MRCARAVAGVRLPPASRQALRSISASDRAGWRYWDQTRKIEARLARESAIAHHMPMVQNQFPGTYRVIVKARSESRVRDFVWEIVRTDDPDAKAVDRSIRAFKTMEEAYASGAAALERHSKRP
jgi:hypothetical protein